MATADLDAGFEDVTGSGDAPPPAPAVAPAAASALPASAANPGSLAASGRVEAPPQAPDPDAGFDAFTIPGSTVEQKLKAGAQSTVKGAIDTGAITTGLIAGGALGAEIGAPFAPVNLGLSIPIGATIGAAVGGFAGWYGAKGADTALGLKSPEELPEDQRPLAYGGEMLGSGVGSGTGISALAKSGLKVGLPVLQHILDGARAAPLSSILFQTGSGAVGGIAGTEAEEAEPGNAGVRIPAEIIGSLLSPSGLAMTAARVATEATTGAKAFMSSAGQMTIASRALFNAIKAGKEDPALIQAALSNPDALGVPLTAAQKTGSPAIAALEKSLIDNSAPFGERILARTTNALNSLKNLYSQLVSTGEPAALSAAAVARSAYYRTMIGGSVNSAINDAITAARNISKDAPDAINQISKIAQTTVGGSLDLVSPVEADLWSRVDKTIPAGVDNVLAAHDALSSRLPLGGKLPPLVDQLVAPLREAAEEGGETLGEEADQPVLTGDLINLRSYMLKQARIASAGANPDPVAAAAYGKIADGALADLNDVGASGPNGTFNEAFDAARQFSREKNDIFGRTFAAKATSTTSSGADSISPEAYLGKALGSGGVMGDVHMQELLDATQFMANHGMDSEEAASNVQNMIAAQNRLIRLTAARTIGSDGRINMEATSAFLRNNAGLLNRFPAIKSDLEGAISSEANAKQVESAYSGKNPAGENQAMLGDLLGTDSPVTAVGRALRGPTPQSDLNKMIGLTKSPEGGEAAQGGLRSAVLSDAITQATDTKGALDFNKLDDELNGPLQPGLSSSVSLLRQGGVMDDAANGRLTQILALGQKMTNEISAGTKVDHGTTILGNLIEFLAKVGGTSLGSAVSKAVLGRTSIIAQGYFAKTSRQLLEAATDKAGATNAVAVLQNALEDSKMMALLMKTPQGPHAMLTALSHIQNYLVMGAAKPIVANAPDLLAGGEPPQNPQERQEAPLALVPPAEASTPRSEAAPSPAPAPEAAIEPTKPTGGRALLPLIAKLENSDDDAKSLAGAVGRYQIELGTAKSYDPAATVEKLKTPAYNEEIAGKILDDLFAKFKGNVAQVLANYNASPRATKTFMKTGDPSSLPSETQKYLKRARDMGALE